MPPVKRNNPINAKSSDSQYTLMDFIREYPDDATCLEWLWRAKEHRNKALAGLILSVIGLILCTIMVIGLLAFIIENVPDPYFRY